MGELDLSDELEPLRASAPRFAAEQLAPAARARRARRALAGRGARGPRELLAARARPARAPGRRRGRLSRQGRAARDTRRAATRAVCPPRIAAGMAAGALDALSRPEPGGARSPLPACRARAVRAGRGRSRAPGGPRAGVGAAVAGAALGVRLRGRADCARSSSARPLEPAPALAFHASGGGSCALADARVLGDWKLSTQIGVAIRGRARLWLAAVAVGVGQAAFDATLAYTRERIVFGKPVAHHQGNAFELAVAATNLQGARLLRARRGGGLRPRRPARGLLGDAGVARGRRRRDRRDRPRRAAPRRARLPRRPPGREALPRGAHAGAARGRARSSPRPTWRSLVLDVPDPLFAARRRRA